MLSNPYGCHMQVLTGPAKNIALSQRGGRILKLVSPATLDRGFIQQWRANNPGGMVIYRAYFGDNDLDDWKWRCDDIKEQVRHCLDLVDVVETPYNECNEGINDGIADLADTEINCADYLRANLPGIKVSGGHFSVGTPYWFPQDYAAYSVAFKYLDYFSLHEYDAPAVDSGVLTTGGNDYATGWKVLRYRRVLDWADAAGIKVPPIILSEFGVDGGGQGHGFRNDGAGIGDYLRGLRRVAVWLNEDIARGRLVGAAVFCVGAPDWPTFDLSTVPQFGDLLNEELPGSTVVTRPSGVKVAPATEFEGWAEDPQNKHKPGTWDYLNAFIEDREDNAGVPRGTFGWDDAKAGGFPQAMLNSVVSAQVTGGVEFTARRLGVPPHRIAAVRDVESAGAAFGSPGKALIRFELHLFLGRISDECRAQAAIYFRVQDGVEQVRRVDMSFNEWADLQDQDQEVRYSDLLQARSIDSDLAFRCTSMGLFQILGEHFATLAYGTAKEMFQALSQSEGAQWKGFEDFVAGDPPMHRALFAGDAAEFARLYNGDSAVYTPLLLAAGF